MASSSDALQASACGLEFVCRTPGARMREPMEPNVAVAPGTSGAALGALPTVLSLVTPARAEPGWLRLYDQSACAVSETELRARIERAVAGPQHPALRVEVELERMADGSEPARVRQPRGAAARDESTR